MSTWLIASANPTVPLPIHPAKGLVAPFHQLNNATLCTLMNLQPNTNFHRNLSPCSSLPLPPHMPKEQLQQALESFDQVKMEGMKQAEKHC